MRLRLARALLMVTLGGAGLLTGCSWFGGSSDKKEAAPAVATEASEATMRKNCADPKWRDQNMGLWYSVCREPLRW